MQDNNNAVGKCDLLGYRFQLLLITVVLLVSVLCGCTDDRVSISTVGQEATDENACEETETVDIETSTVSLNVSTEEEASARVCVYVCGAVQNEGVYELESGARIKDALEKAGGYSEEAYRGYVNLAEIITDGQQIYIPTTEEVGNKSMLQTILRNPWFCRKWRWIRNVAAGKYKYG